jgi:hypothetical protein
MPVKISYSYTNHYAATVAELIAHLQTFDPSLPLFYYWEGQDIAMTISSVAKADTMNHDEPGIGREYISLYAEFYNDTEDD